MTDIETQLSAALSEQARAAARSGTGPDGGTVFDVRSGPVGRRRPVRRPIALAGSVLATAAAIVAAAVAVDSVNATHGSVSNTVAVGAPQTSAPSPYGIPAGHFLKVTSGPRTYWIPSDITATWRLLNTGDGAPTVDERARCAAFPFFGGNSDANQVPIPGSVPGCTASLGWEWFRPQFTESLPSDPAAILASLEANLPAQDNRWQRAADAFSNGTGFLAQGIVSDRVAKNIEAALGKIEGVVVTGHVSNGAGGYGTLIALTTPLKTTGKFTTSGVVVDPVTGRVEAGYFFYPAMTFTTDPRTSQALRTRRTDPASTTISPVRYQLVTSAN